MKHYVQTGHTLASSYHPIRFHMLEDKNIYIRLNKLGNGLQKAQNGACNPLAVAIVCNYVNKNKERCDCWGGSSPLSPL